MAPTPDNRIVDLENQVKELTAKVEATDPAAIERRLNRLDKVRALEEKSVDVRIGVLKNPRAVDGRATLKFLQVTSRLSRPDDLAVVSLDGTARFYRGGYDKAKEFIQTNGLGLAMTRVTSRLNSTALDETARYILSSPEIYGALVFVVLDGVGTGDRTKLEKFAADSTGFISTIREKLEADDGPRHRFVRALVKETFRKNDITFDEKKGAVARLIADLREHPVPLSVGRVEPAIEAAHDAALRVGSFPTLVDAFVETKEIDKQRFTPQIRQAMVRHLIERGISIDIDDPDQMQKFAEGGYDEYFAVAYEQAVSSAAGEDDPIDAATVKGATVAPWDFTIDTFETMEEQGVVKDNILAAGALDYVFELGERMGLFRLADALTLNWAAGAIDVVDGPCAGKLYRYWKLRDQRSDPAERGLVYKRVLNKGEAEVLERMVANEAFPTLWGTLMEKVTEYISKVEEAKVEIGDTLLVSRVPMYQAIRNLQSNLTEFCTGMAHMQIREMYSQLRETLDLLGDPEIIDHFAGGRRKNLWTAIERLSRSEFGEAPNISAIRTAAVEGNAVFRFCANFQQGAVAEDEFQRFIEGAEAWIIAKGSDETELAPVGVGAEENGDFSDSEDDNF